MFRKQLGLNEFLASVVYITDGDASYAGLGARLALDFVSTSNWTPRENYDLPTILRCAERIQEFGHPIRILLAGDGPLRPLVEATIRERKLHSITYLGRLDVDVLCRLYAQCDLALSTYVANSTVSMPIKAYDYFAAGLPQVNSLGRDLGELIRRHQLGLQYEPGNPESLLAALVTLANNPQLRLIARINALAISPSFDWRRQYGKAVRFIEKIGAEIR